MAHSREDDQICRGQPPVSSRPEAEPAREISRGLLSSPTLRRICRHSWDNLQSHTHTHSNSSVHISLKLNPATQHLNVRVLHSGFGFTVRPSVGLPRPHAAVPGNPSPSLCFLPMCTRRHLLMACVLGTLGPWIKFWILAPAGPSTG